ncbi:ABC transporter ATP-binding protein [Halobaculum sp. MBLA0143]|uniref:ABC transporter ATP-binding protein n=1 Tax=Halobaculum sp. MBLA0143 TaxID=3079933 RepID=UPI003525BC31
MSQNDKQDRSDILTVRDLQKTYGSGEEAVTAVDGVSFGVERGSITGLLGHNGAGKTTLIKMILGLVTPTAGSVVLGDEDVTGRSKAVASRAAAVLEGARTMYWRLTVRENVEFFTRLAGNTPGSRAQRNEELYEAFDIAHRVDKTVNELSRGMKQKASIVTVLSQEPDLLVLDEPTLGLDVESSLELRRQLQEIVAERDTTVLVSSHDMAVVEEICDRAVILSDGVVVADESVASLMDLFETQTVTVTLTSPPAELLDTIESRFRVSTHEAIGDRHQIELSIKNSAAMHSLTGVIAEHDAASPDIETAQLDFEEVYLQLTREQERTDDRSEKTANA